MYAIMYDSLEYLDLEYVGLSNSDSYILTEREKALIFSDLEEAKDIAQFMSKLLVGKFTIVSNDNHENIEYTI